MMLAKMINFCKRSYVIFRTECLLGPIYRPCSGVVVDVAVENLFDRGFARRVAPYQFFFQSVYPSVKAVPKIRYATFLIAKTSRKPSDLVLRCLIEPCEYGIGSDLLSPFYFFGFRSFQKAGKSPSELPIAARFEGLGDVRH